MGNARPIVYRMTIHGGDRLFVDAREPPRPAAVAGPLLQHWCDVAPIVTCVERDDANGLRASYFSSEAELRPTIEDLVFTFWFVKLASLTTAAQCVSDGLPGLATDVLTSIGRIRFELPLWRTGNHLRVLSATGALLAESNLFDWKCLTLRPNGQGLLALLL